jgi:hypothetical protein
MASIGGDPRGGTMRRVRPSGPGRRRVMLLSGAAAGALIILILWVVAARQWNAVQPPQPFPTPEPLGAPVAGLSIRVASVSALLNALADDEVAEIVVADGTYRVQPASDQARDSLWIGSRFATRTRPVLVRAEHRGGVTFDGGGAKTFGGITFTEGANNQTWDGFRFANGEATETGVIVFGGYAGLAAPHHITLRAIEILGTCTGHNDRHDHAVYFSYAVGGPHDILIDGLSVDGTGPRPLSTALHFFHSDAANANAWNTTVRRLVVTGTYTAISIWDRTLHDVTIDTASITNARYGAVQYEEPGERITLRNVLSTGSGDFGFYSTLGDAPPGITIINSSLD